MRFRGSGGWLVVAIVAASASACDSGDGVVGGSCAAGYVDCNNTCVRVGQCGGGMTDARADGREARDGRANDASDARVTDAPTHDGTMKDAGPEASTDASDSGHDGPSPDAPSDAPKTDAVHSDGSATDAKSFDSSADAPHDTGVDSCAPPYNTPAQCGSCGAACSAVDFCSPLPDAGVDGGAYSCVASCPMPYVPCHGVCLDVSSDPFNCGACGNVCPSGICVANVCEGATSGDIVVIGHDYAAATILVSEATLVTNAVFLPPTNPLRVLSFEEYAVPGQVANVKTTLKNYAPLGRSITYTVVNDYTTIGAKLTMQSFDVLLVYDQAAAPVNTLGTVGSTLAGPIATFVAAGGDVVVLDGASGTTKQMTSFLSMSNLLQTTADTPIPATDKLLVIAPGDAVGNFVVSPYAPIADSVYFTTTEPNGANGVSYVVDDLSGGNLVPVVIHKTAP